MYSSNHDIPIKIVRETCLEKKSVLLVLKYRESKESVGHARRQHSRNDPEISVHIVTVVRVSKCAIAFEIYV